MPANPIPSTKKGIGHFGGASALAIDWLGCNWYYNWRTQPTDEAVRAEFVPMVWNGNRLAENLRLIQNSRAKVLLGFNEPDNRAQARLSVARAIALWPQLMAIGLRLGSPATMTGSRWLDDFMTECQRLDLRVDFLCLHWYGDITRPAAVAALQSYLLSYWKRFGLPIWLTEFSGADFKYHQRKTTLADTANFARAALPMLESLPFLERYAWYGYAWNRRSRTYPFVGVFDTITDSLTPVGLAYQNPQNE